MRIPTLLASLAIVMLAQSGAAQTGLRSASLPDRTPTSPLPPTGTQTGLRSASLPDRSPQQPIPPDVRDVWLARPDAYVPRFDEFGRPLPPFPIGFGFGGDVFGGSFGPAYAGMARGSMMPMARGYLHLDVQPGDAQVHVDGLYMGTVDDFRRLIPGRALEAGAHRIEVRAPGFEPLTFDARILPNETLTFRQPLEPRREEVRASPAPAAPKTFYVIPGCYAGDRPPRNVRLPKGCDPANVRAIPPTIGPAGR